MKKEIPTFQKIFSFTLLISFIAYSIGYVFSFFEEKDSFLLKAVFILITFLLVILCKKTILSKKEFRRYISYTISLGFFSIVSIIISTIEHAYISDLKNSLVIFTIVLNTILFGFLLISYMILREKRMISKIISLVLISTIIGMNLLKAIIIPSCCSVNVDYLPLILQILFLIVLSRTKIEIKKRK